MSPKPHLKDHNRRYSWPPFKLSNFSRKKDIDDDPFSFFISPPEDLSAELSEEQLNAVIQQKIRPRSLSPRAAQNRIKILQNPAISMLRDWLQRMEKRYFHRKVLSKVVEQVLLPTPPQSPLPSQTAGTKRSAPDDEDDEPMLDVFDISVSPPLRGRRRTRSQRRRYGDRVIRSHSKKARVWREPDDDLWPVIEESEEVGLGINIETD